jgi:hypothetical protein
MQTIADWQKLGLTLLLDFISSEEEQQLVDGIVSTYRPSIGMTSAKYRNSIHRFGDGDIYKDNLVSAVIPDYFAPAINKLIAAQLIAGQPDAVTVNEYLAGQRIHPHIDAPEAGPVITVLSLLSPAVMLFTCGDDKFEVIDSNVMDAEDIEDNNNVIVDPVVYAAWTHPFLKGKEQFIVDTGCLGSHIFKDTELLTRSRISPLW